MRKPDILNIKFDPETERQVGRLREYAIETTIQKEELRRHYKKNLREIEQLYKKNERSFQNIRRVRHLLIGSRTFVELITTIIRELRQNNVDHVSIGLNLDYIPMDSSGVQNLPSDVRTALRFIPERDLKGAFLRDNQYSTRMGPRDKVDVFGFFGVGIRSCLIAPLSYQDKLMGSLFLGSRTPTRYSEDREPDLLEDLAITAALCLDNVITHEKNEQLATTDPLTGARNRRFFYDQAALALDLANRHGDPVSCIYIDLNDFKPINDNFGHDAGDLALKRLVDTVHTRVRRTDVFARLGGDEFILLLPRIDGKQAQNLAEDLRDQVANISFDDHGHKGMILTAAFGAAQASPGDSVDDMIQRADKAMYTDKGERKR